MLLKTHTVIYFSISMSMSMSIFSFTYMFFFLYVCLFLFVFLPITFPPSAYLLPRETTKLGPHLCQCRPVERSQLNWHCKRAGLLPSPLSSKWRDMQRVCTCSPHVHLMHPYLSGPKAFEPWTCQEQARLPHRSGSIASPSYS